VNAGWLRATGLTLEEALGKDILGHFPEARDVALALHARARAGHHVELPLGVRRVAGRETWWTGSIDPVPMEGGTGLLLTLREAPPGGGADARQEGDQVVPREWSGRAQGEDLFRLLARAMPQVVCVLRPDGFPEYVNPSWITLSGLDLEETARAGWKGVLHPDDLEVVQECRRRVLKLLSPQDVEIRFRAAGGAYRWFLGRLAPIVEGGRVSRLVGAALDIEDRKRAETALRESERKFATIFHHSPLALGLTRLPRGEIADVNEAWVRMMGIPRYEAMGKTTAELGVVVDPRERRRLYEEVWSRGSVSGLELRCVTRTNGLRTFSASADVITFEGARFLLIALLDVTDRNAAAESLRLADRRKDEFLGMLSHELRNPLAPIRNSVYVLRRSPGGSERSGRALDVIERQTEHLTRLVDDLLDVTRIASGKIELRRARVDLRELARRSAEDHRAAFEDRGITFRTSLPAAPLWLSADATRISQVLGNLLANSAKFTRAGGEVTLSLASSGASAELAVADTGAGIEPGLLPHVFEPFVQAERTRERTQGGLGLGLALVKGIAELHGGSVRAESAGKGRGTRISILLPMDGAQPVDAAAARPRRAPHVRHRVLVVDDNRDAADSLAQVVEMLGHDAEVAYDGQAALAKVRGRPPDVVLCDIGLPGMDGYEVARRIRAMGERNVRLVAVTGYAQPEDLARAARAGFDRHVSKPADPERIQDVLE
jgi:PAS domain S-box-containing protein